MAFSETDRWTVVEGPVKREVIVGTSDATDSFTVTTRIQNPQYVHATGMNGSPTPSDMNVDVSGRTLTITNPDAEDYRIVAEGY